MIAMTIKHHCQIGTSIFFSVVVFSWSHQNLNAEKKIERCLKVVGTVDQKTDDCDRNDAQRLVEGNQFYKLSYKKLNSIQ